MCFLSPGTKKTVQNNNIMRVSIKWGLTVEVLLFFTTVFFIGAVKNCNGYKVKLKFFNLFLF